MPTSQIGGVEVASVESDVGWVAQHMGGDIIDQNIDPVSCRSYPQQTRWLIAANDQISLCIECKAIGQSGKVCCKAPDFTRIAIIPDIDCGDCRGEGLADIEPLFAGTHGKPIGKIERCIAPKATFTIIEIV